MSWNRSRSRVRLDIVEDGVWLANRECFNPDFLIPFLKELEKLGLEPIPSFSGL